ncbi:MAG: uncharacterized protein V7637_2149 [Mycobacteriales bacterium]
MARGEDRPDSDVDILADMPAGLGMFGLLQLQAELETILGAHVDLVPAPGLKPDVGSRVATDLVPL